MSEAPIDPRWPKILSLAVHELRTPMTVVAGVPARPVGIRPPGAVDYVLDAPYPLFE